MEQLNLPAPTKLFEDADSEWRKAWWNLQDQIHRFYWWNSIFKSNQRKEVAKWAWKARKLLLRAGRLECRAKDALAEYNKYRHTMYKPEPPQKEK